MVEQEPVIYCETMNPIPQGPPDLPPSNRDVFPIPPGPPDLPPRNRDVFPQFRFQENPTVVSQSHNRCCQNIFSTKQVALIMAVVFFAALSITFIVIHFTADNENRNSSNEKKNVTSIATPKPKSKVLGKSCADLYKNGVKSGVYTIDPDCRGTFDVRCDMTTDGGGWTVFQRRMDGSVDFYLKWADYKNGFGNLSGEFWLGLDKINRLSESGQDVLRVDLEDFENEIRYAKYNTFAMADETGLYKLTVTGYSGDAGDSLARHNGMKFSTKDKDNDKWSRNCAVHYKSAWWYNGCHAANLNGLYLRGTNTKFAQGVVWEHWKGDYYSLKTTEMKIRPRNF